MISLSTSWMDGVIPAPPSRPTTTSDRHQAAGRRSVRGRWSPTSRWVQVGHLQAELAGEGGVVAVVVAALRLVSLVLRLVSLTLRALARLWGRCGTRNHGQLDLNPFA
jgi:hypothetical protein